jgi:hypothetical protein
MPAADLFRRRKRTVEVPEYGTFYVRSMTALTRQRIAELSRNGSFADAERLIETQIVAVIHGLTDENGKRLYDENPETIKRIREDVDVALLDRLAREIVEASGMTITAVEEVEKNLPIIPSESSQ